jgi:hypothetical protein
MASVHDFSEEVPEIGVGHFAVTLLDLVHEHLAADSEVAVIEVLLTGPPQRSELYAPHNQRVIHTQGEQDGLEFLRTGGFVQLLLRETVLGAFQVRLEVRRCFISHFDGRLQNGLWDDLHVW